MPVNKNKKTLSQNITRILKDMGASKIGIAPAERLKKAPEGFRPGDILSGAKNVIAIAISQIPSVVDNVPAARFTFSQQYHVITRKLDDLAMAASRFLDKEGFSTVQIPADGFYDRQSLRAHLYHEEAAAAAGLGEIGLNNMLITPEYGARLQLVTVITDAPLEASPEFKKGLCKRWQKKCHLVCAKMCPVECISEKDGFRKELCIYYHNKFLSEGLHIYIPNVLCGLCVKACKGFD